jgi:hypothetical protein
MRKPRSIRPGVENLEPKVVLSTGVAAHMPAHAEIPSVVVDVARRPVHLIGSITLGSGTVSPLGGVRAAINLGQKTLNLSNGQGAVKLKLSQVRTYPTTWIAHAYKVMTATGHFKALHGQGNTSVTATIIHGRVHTWSASFW